MPQFIPLKDEERLKEIGCPFTKKTLYNFRSQGKYPGLVVKVGGTLCLNVDKLKELAEKDIKWQEKRAKRLFRDARL